MLGIRVFFLLLVVFSFSIVYSQSERRVKANDCISLWMIQEAKESYVDWLVLAENKCSESETMGKNLRITQAVNVNLHEGLVLETKDFIVGANKQKLVFTASKEDLEKKAILSWTLIDP